LPGVGAGIAWTAEEKETENAKAITRQRAATTASDFRMQNPPR
jgi:hypothetical protein